MRRYSDFFVTLHDEQGPVGHLGRGLHYSVLRAVIWPNGQPKLHDFGIVWDEDHDTRVIVVAERLYLRGLLPDVLLLGEAKGHLRVFFDAPPRQQMRTALDEVGDSVGNDHFTNEVEVLAESETFLRGVAERWRLGTKGAIEGTLIDAPVAEPAKHAVTRSHTPRSFAVEPGISPVTFSVARLVRHLTQLERAIDDERSVGGEVVGVLTDIIDARTTAASPEQFMATVDSHLEELLDIYEQPSG